MKKIILSLSAIVAFTQITYGQASIASNSITSSNYLGSSNNVPFWIKTNNLNRMYFNTAGQVGVGNNTTLGAGLHLFHTTENTSMKIQTSGLNNADIAFLSGTNQSDIHNFYNLTNLGGILRFNSLATGTSLAFYSYSGATQTEFFRVSEAGNFGIGTATPSYKLHVKNELLTSGTAVRVDAINGHIRLFETDGINPDNNYTQIERNGNAFHIYQYNHATTSFTPVLTADMSGNVSIGVTNSSGYKFAVKGNMIAEQVVVKLYGTWPDFVFNKKHDLMKLSDVEKYINENSHLPNVPSEKEIVEGGIDLGKMDAVLLQKIEELTLYIIELKKENEQQQKVIDELIKK